MCLDITEPLSMFQCLFRENIHDPQNILVEYHRCSVSNRNGICQVYITCVFNKMQMFSLHLGFDLRDAACHIWKAY
jgi:hypothetical protein